MEFRNDLQLYGKLAAHRVGYVAGQLELTSKCAQRCAMCESWRDDRTGVVRGELELETVLDVFNQLNAMPTFEHLALTGGDPQSWPNLLHLLKNYGYGNFRFALQLNTALCFDDDWELWRRTVRDVRVSLDGATPETYYAMRGDKRDPKEIVERIKRMNHPRVATNTCVTSRNIDEVPKIIELLEGAGLRKAMFLAVIGPRDSRRNDEDFWKKYDKLKELQHFGELRSSFAEDVVEVRQFCASEEAKPVPCYAGAISFHIKCNGDVYPCCLVGGEALTTDKDFCIGNIKTNTLSVIQQRYRPACHYANPKSPCVSKCQWKQLQINRIAHEASKTMMAMP